MLVSPATQSKSFSDMMRFIFFILAFDIIGVSE